MVSLANRLARGPEDVAVVIPEGFTVYEIDKRLSDFNLIKAGSLIELSQTPSEFSSQDKFVFLPVDNVVSLEGFLFPDTYRVFEKTTAAEIIEKMLDNFSVKYTEQMRQDTAKGNMTIYQIVTLASVIEKEVRTDTDRKIAAGIFYDRLNLGVPLQSDATVNYVTGKNLLQPTNDDISVDSLYNTYKYKGLPPGPICNPSLSSIMAAIYPEKSDYFYFLTRPDGSTVFSKTYEEHLANKRKYLQ